MEIISIFGIISAIIILGFIAEIIFKKTNIPDVLILLIIGIIIGPILNLANVTSFGEGSKLFTTFTLVFILFQGALNINFKAIFESLSIATKVTLISFIFTVFIVSIISYTLYHNWLISILIGMILGGTSSAVVIPIVTSIEMREKYRLVMILESAITDVLCIVGAITILQIIDTGNVFPSLIFKNILTSFSLALVIGTIFGLIWIFLLKKYEILINSYILTVAMVIGLYAFVESSFVSASGAIAALTFGLILGNSKTILELWEKDKNLVEKTSENKEKIKQHRDVLSNSAKTFYSEISFFVKTFFFVYLGIMIDFSNHIIFAYGAAIVLGVYLVRPFAIKLAFKKEHIERQDRVLMEVLVPKGLAAAVLAGLAVQSGLLEIYEANFINLILSVVLISIFLSSVLVYLSGKAWFNGLIPFLNKKNISENRK